MIPKSLTKTELASPMPKLESGSLLVDGNTVPSVARVTLSRSIGNLASAAMQA